MPGMTGLELVEQMQADFPEIPAILITAQGSEVLAVQALRHGAAAYVPKTMLEALLDTTIRDVLGVLRADRSYARLIDALDRNEMEFRLPSEPFLIAPLVDLVNQLIAGMGVLSGNELVRFSTAFDHALQNGMLHGNLEITPAQVATFRQSFADGVEPEFIVKRRQEAPYRDRRLAVQVRIEKDAVYGSVTDEGPGFDISLVPSLQSVERILGTDGRGLVLLTSFMDEVRYNKHGNQVHFTKRSRSPLPYRRGER
jgi:CheY-like chemotaxis protein